MEKEVRVNLKEKSYSIFIGKNLLEKSQTYLKHLSLGKKILIITQKGIPKLYLNKLTKSLKKSGFLVFSLLLENGEEYKDISSLLKITNFAIKNKFERNDTFISLGGGVVSDLTGFAASIYYRGLNFISIPTTLLSMVDAAVGGKTAVNTPFGKNLLGTFYQPKIVIIDINTLKTLPKKEFSIGMAEVIKYAFLEGTAKTSFNKKPFYDYLIENKKRILSLKEKSLIDIIYYSCIVKAKVVSKDEKESNLRAILNLGHTFAHGFEQAYNYKKYTHGEAVSMGMYYASVLAEKKKLIKTDTSNLTSEILLAYNLPTSLKEKNKINTILESMLLDKKVKDGKLRFILPASKIGKVEMISGINQSEIKELLRNY